MPSIVISKTKTANGLRPVLLDGADIGGCSVGRERYSSRTQVSFYPGGRMPKGAQPWLFSTLADLRERLPQAWQTHTTQGSTP